MFINFTQLSIKNVPFVQQLDKELLSFDAHAHFQSFDFLLLLPINYTNIAYLQKKNKNVKIIF
jgi:hypothetical protein